MLSYKYGILATAIGAAIPLAWYAYFYPKKVVSAGDRVLVTKIAGLMTSDEFDEEADEAADCLYRANAVESDDEGDLGMAVEGHGQMVVRRRRRSRFISSMIWWLKTEFPSAVSMRTTADDAVMRLAVTRHMRAMHVRNQDIATALPYIMAGVYMPCRADRVVGRAMATHLAKEEYDSHIGWRAPRWSWLEEMLVSRPFWWPWSTVSTGFKLTTK